MNQILITGDEQIVKKVKKEKEVIPINKIVIFYAISIIILGICMISGSVYARDQINRTVEASKKPEISVERNDEDNTISITVTHIRGIKNVTYKWNDGEEITINGNNQKSISEVIDLIGGENILKITATEENGQTSTLQKAYTVGNIPEIEIVNESIDNGIKIYASSEEIIDYVQYSWDDGEMQTIEVGEKEYEGIINTPQGQHTLKIIVVDKIGMKAETERTVIGDTEPILKIEVKLVDEKAVFSINAEDDENIKTITIIHNGGEEQEIRVNEKTYYKDIVMTEGEKNTLIVKVVNKNDLENVQKVKFDNYY